MKIEECVPGTEFWAGPHKWKILSRDGEYFDCVVVDLRGVKKPAWALGSMGRFSYERDIEKYVAINSVTISDILYR